MKGAGRGVLRAQFTFILTFYIKLWFHSLVNAKLLKMFRYKRRFKMLYLIYTFCVIDKYIKNNEKFKYFSLKYNMTSKSVKFFFYFLNL